MERGMKIIHNRIRCKNCGQVIESMSQHDWVCCDCFHKSDGKTGCFVDGGKTYLRSGGDPKYIEGMYEIRPFTDEEVDEYNHHQELLAEQYGWIKINYMEK